VLNTRVDNPHGAHKVTALVFHPRLPVVISVGQDQRFKVWQYGEADGGAWYCRGIGLYRDYLCRGAALSEDGSVLAVAYGQVITLWDPFTLRLQATLVHPPPETPVLYLHFVRHTHYLVAATATHLYVWDLLTLSVWWSLQLDVLALAVDPAEPRFVAAVRAPAPAADEGGDANAGRAAAAPTVHVLVFHPASPTPLLHYGNVGLDGCSAIAFVPRRTAAGSPGSAPRLAAAPVDLLLRSGGSRPRLYRLRPASADADAEATAKAGAAAAAAAGVDRRSTGLLSALYGAGIVTEAAEAAAAAAAREADVAATTAAVVNPTTLPAVLDAPVHTIPRMTKVYEHFMRQLLVRRPAEPAPPAASVPSTGAGAGATDKPAAAAAAPAVEPPPVMDVLLESQRDGASPYAFLAAAFEAMSPISATGTETASVMHCCVGRGF